MTDKIYNVLFLCTGNSARSILGEAILNNDGAAGEACPVGIGHPMTAHWGIEDAAAVEGNEADKQRAFAQAARVLKNRISAFLSLPHATIDRIALQNHLREIGTIEGSTQKNSEKS